MILEDWPDEGLMYDSRKSFYESWISESPQRLYARNDFNDLLYNLTGIMKLYQSKEILPNLYFVEGSQVVFVYYKQNNEITTIVELEKKPQAIWVTNIAKKEEYKNKPPFMSDIYKEILSIANKRSLMVISDKMITDSGLNVWKKLMANGYTISVYDTTKSGPSLIKLSNIVDLQNYISDNQLYQKYRFILSENSNWVSHLLEFFIIRRTRELAGITSDEDYE